MKVLTLIKKLFGEQRVADMIDVKHEDDECIEYYSIDENEGDSEPSYIIKVFPNGYNVVSTIDGEVLHESFNTSKLKRYLKNVLAVNN